jgi:hypothetical protein
MWFSGRADKENRKEIIKKEKKYGREKGEK